MKPAVELFVNCIEFESNRLRKFSETPRISKWTKDQAVVEAKGDKLKRQSDDSYRYGSGVETNLSKRICSCAYYQNSLFPFSSCMHYT